MYQIISNMINHTWITQNAGEQQYIYYICGAMICVLAAVVFDNIFRIFRMLIRKIR